jgi:hypothetical protein
MAEARKRYEVGLQLYDDGNYQAARIEFERSMQLAPSYRILYNIGLVYRQLNDYTGALSAFERYLSEGGTQVKPERKAEVEKEVAGLIARVGTIHVTTNVPGAEILVDDISVGTAPLATPLRLNPGMRKVSVQAPGYMPASKTLPISTSENPALNLDLVELPKTKYFEKKQNPWTLPMVIGISATGATLAGTVVFGILGLSAKSKQNDDLKVVNGPDLNSARDKTQTLSGVSDILLISTVVLAGASTYFTLKKLSWRDTSEARPGAAKLTPTVNFAPTGVRGTF